MVLGSGVEGVEGEAAKAAEHENKIETCIWGSVRMTGDLLHIMIRQMFS